MGWFSRSKKKTCDWCGAKFSEGGVETDDGMLLCGDECLSQKQAPNTASGRTRKKPRGRPVPTLDSAKVEVGLAEEQFEEYQRLQFEAQAASRKDEFADRISAAALAYSEAWRYLGEAILCVRHLEGDDARFAMLKDYGFGLLAGLAFTATSGMDRETITAETEPGRELALYNLASQEVMYQLDLCAQATGRPALFGSPQPDPRQMAETLARCAKAKTDRDETPDLFKIMG